METPRMPNIKDLKSVTTFMRAFSVESFTQMARNNIRRALPQGGDAIASLLDEVTWAMHIDPIANEYILQTRWHWKVDEEGFEEKKTDRFSMSDIDRHHAIEGSVLMIEKATRIHPDELLKYAAYI